jgi:uncharacterized protein YbjQ (UPF0145 family)
MNDQKNNATLRSSFRLAAQSVAGLIALAGLSTGCSVSAASPTGQADATHALAREASEIDIWVTGTTPPGVVRSVGSFTDEERLTVGARCSSHQRAMMEVGARLEAIEALRRQAAASGADGLMDVRCDGSHTIRSFTQTCTGIGFLYPMGAGDLMNDEAFDPEAPVLAGPDAARRAAFALSVMEASSELESAQD